MNIHKYFILFILTALLFGCAGPAQPPAAPPATQAPTQLPPPSPTSEPTPEPYNLDLTVKDPDGQPIPGASAELDGQTVQAGASGIISFSDLSAGPLALTVSAPGYQTQQLSQTLQPGDNPVEVVLQPDPFSLLPGNACAEGETLLYMEDFQDGQAQGWDAIEGQAPGWSVEEDPDQPGNQLAAARGPNNLTWAWYDRENASFDNVVWRLRVMTQGQSRTHLNFRFIENTDFNGRYFITTGGDGGGVVRYVNNQHLDLGPLGQPAPDEWRLYEIGYFDGELIVFLDGEQQLVYQDPQPWEGGTLNLEPYPGPDGSPILFDNLSLCALSAPPQPLPKPKTGYELSLAVTDLEGQPLNLASVSVADADGKPLESLTLDATGMATLSDLPSGALIVTAGAPGYLPLEQGLIIEKGEPAELTLALERDTLGLAPEQACAANETLLYLEDFNDGQAQGWPNIQAAKELSAQNGWTILEEPGGNILLQAANSLLPATDNLEGVAFDDAVWRVKVLYEGNDTDGFLNWRRSFDQGDWRYFVPFGGPQLLQLLRFTSGEVVQAAQSSLQLTTQKWHLFEISTYQGTTEVWLDGKRVLSYTDPQPLPPGTIGLEMHLREGVQTVFWFDDLAVCGLSAPFEPLPPLP